MGRKPKNGKPVINPSCRKAKPIFVEEKEFIEQHLRLTLPDDCWITGGSTKYIWGDIYHRNYILKFRVNPATLKFELVQDNRDKFKNINFLSMREIIAKEQERILNAYEKDLERLIDFVKNHIDVPYTVSVSGGKDSEVIFQMWKDMLSRTGLKPKYEYVFLNTTNEAPSVYKYIKSHPEIRIFNPEEGWRQWIRRNNYSLPTVFRRSCCGTYKEGQAKKYFDTSAPLIQVMGMRNKESTKRAEYEFYMNHDWNISHRGKSSIPAKWVTLCPIIDWETVDIWLLILLKDWYIDERYKFGHSRVGCLFCPYSNSYEDVLNREYYPIQWLSFSKILDKAYDIQGWGLRRTKEEYKNFYWKNPTSADNEILSEYTEENVKEYAKERGLSIEMARKFFNNTCGGCGKRCTSAEVGMFLKTFGRFEGVKDDRKPLCGRCAGAYRGGNIGARQRCFTSKDASCFDICNKERKVIKMGINESYTLGDYALTTTPNSIEYPKPRIHIKYFDKEIDKIAKLDNGDWIDLRAAETIHLNKGDSVLIPLGVGMILPPGYEAHVVPRGSTYKNYGIIQTNHMGVIDESYCGDNDQWFFPAYALRDTVIHKNDRICQFRIMMKQPPVTFEEVERLKDNDRGGFGSTGRV